MWAQLNVNEEPLLLLLRRKSKNKQTIETKTVKTVTSNGAATVVSRDPGEGYRGGGCLGHCEARLVGWN